MKNTGVTGVEQPITLSVETATRAGSVCVSRGIEVLASALGDPQVSHSNTLLRDIHKVLAESQITISEVELLAAAVGPGSFTGLRIGLATVKGLATTLGIPCIGISTLQAIARAAGPSLASVALLPAGRGEVFAQMFSVEADGSVVDLDRAAHLSPQALRQRYGAQPSIRWCGEGAHLHRDTLAGWAKQQGIDFYETQPDPIDVTLQGWQLAPLSPNLALEVAALAQKRFAEGEAADANSLHARYVRPADAELKSNVKNTTSSG